MSVMSTPTVTEITRRPEAVAHDTFIDDLVEHDRVAAPRTALPSAGSRAASR